MVFAQGASEGSAAISPILLGVIVFLIAVVLLLVVLGFRNVGTRHRKR